MPYLLQQHVRALIKTANAMRCDIGNGEALGPDDILALREVREVISAPMYQANPRPGRWETGDVRQVTRSIPIF